MKFVLSFLLVFLCVFATAQVPPMVIGGPQGIDVTRILARNWMSIPIYVDTPVAPLTGSGWPGKGYIIQVAKVGDTSVWQYTGQRWAKIAGASQETYTKLVTGGDVNQLGLSRQYTISPSTYFINGVYYTLSTLQTVTSPVKTANANGRIDVIALTTSGATVVQGTERPVPLKPSIGANRLELAAIYYPAFDTVSREISEGGLTSVFRILGRDSVYFTSGDSVVAVKDSIGISKNDTAAMLNNYKFTAANGLTKDSTVFRLGGSLNQNTNINLNTRRLNIIGGSDTTRFFSNGRVSIGGTPDSTYRFNVNGNTRVNGILRLAPSSPSNAAVIINQNSNDGSIAIGGSDMSLNSSIGSRNIIFSPSGSYSNLTGSQNTLLGRAAGSSSTSASGNVLIGNNAGSNIITGGNNTIIGFGDGHNYSSSTSNAIHIVAGGGYELNKGDTVLLGLSSNYVFIGGGYNSGSFINDIYLGAGNRVRFPDLTHLNLYAPSGFPTKADTIGSNFTINAGRGTGQGLGGSVIFRTSDTTTAGTTLQTLTERARVTPKGNLLVGTSTDNASAIVNVSSTTKGFLPPRMTNTERNAITTPATGLQLFSTTDSANYVYRGTGGGWQKIANEISVSDTLDFPNTSSNNESDLTITVTGASEGDVVAIGVPNAAIQPHSCYTAWVSATNTVTIRFNNYGSGSHNPASAIFKVKVFK